MTDPDRWLRDAAAALREGASDSLDLERELDETLRRVPEGESSQDTPPAGRWRLVGIAAALLVLVGASALFLVGRDETQFVSTASIPPADTAAISPAAPPTGPPTSVSSSSSSSAPMSTSEVIAKDMPRLSPLDTELDNLDVVSVAGSGFQPGSDLVVVQCAAAAASEDDCDFETQVPVLAIDGSGGFDVSFEVRTVIQTADRRELDCTLVECQIFVGDISDGSIRVATPIEWAASAEVPDAPQINIVSLVLDVASGFGSADVVGEGFVPGSEVVLAQCAVDPEDPGNNIGGCIFVEFGPSQLSVADADGKITAQIDTVTQLRLDSGEIIDCIVEPQRCAIANRFPSAGNRYSFATFVSSPTGLLTGWPAPSMQRGNLDSVPRLFPAAPVPSGPVAARNESAGEPIELYDYFQTWYTPDGSSTLTITTHIGQFLRNPNTFDSPSDIPGWMDARFTSSGEFANAQLSNLGGYVTVTGTGLDPDAIAHIAQSIERRPDNKPGWEIDVNIGATSLISFGEGGDTPRTDRSLRWSPGALVAEMSIVSGDPTLLTRGIYEGSQTSVVKVGGVDAIVTNSGRRVAVAWSPEPGIFVHFGLVGTADEAIEVARSVRLLDEQSWEEATVADTSGRDGCNSLFC